MKEKTEYTIEDLEESILSIIKDKSALPSNGITQDRLKQLLQKNNMPSSRTTIRRKMDELISAGYTKHTYNIKGGGSAIYLLPPGASK